MRKFKTIVLQQNTVLGKEQMICIIGGVATSSTHYYVRCDQEVEGESYEISDCSYNAVMDYCGHVEGTVCTYRRKLA